MKTEFNRPCGGFFNQKPKEKVMGSMKDFVQTCGYSIDTKPRSEASCNTCAYLWEKRIFGRMRNYCGLYYKLRKDEVIIPNPTHALCNCHIEKCR